MRLSSFLRFFTRAWQQKKVPFRKRPDKRYAHLRLELLEQREMLSGTPPTIVTAGVLPVSGSVLVSAMPTIRVQFSEAMTNSATLASHYVLLGATTGIVVPLTLVPSAFS